MCYLLSLTLNERIAEIKIEELSNGEMRNGCELLIDSGADSYVAGKHSMAGGNN